MIVCNVKNIVNDSEMEIEDPACMVYFDSFGLLDEKYAFMIKL